MSLLTVVGIGNNSILMVEESGSVFGIFVAGGL